MVCPHRQRLAEEMRANMDGIITLYSQQAVALLNRDFQVIDELEDQVRGLHRCTQLPVSALVPV